MRELIHKKLLLVLGTPLLALALAGLLVPYFLWETGFFPDYGVESGYYGQYNRVKHVIESMPNVRIVAFRQHQDLDLENFGFTLLMDGTREVQVNVYENSPEWRTWRRNRLRELIQRQIDVKQPTGEPAPGQPPTGTQPR